MSIAQIEAEALRLAPDERSALVQRLIDSLESECGECDVSPELAAELERVANHAEAHPETLVSHEQVMREAGELLRK